MSKCGYGLFDSVVGGEKPIEANNLEHTLHLRIQIDQFQVTPIRFRFRQYISQGSQSGAVNVQGLRKIKDQLTLAPSVAFAVRDQDQPHLHCLRDLAGQDGDPILFAFVDFRRNSSNTNSV
jgi:hypothetical protein